MLCTSCKTEISPTFRHALEQNVCPACGGSIMDEESLALLEDIEKTILNEVVLREETVRKLAMAFYSKYHISFNGSAQMKPVQTRSAVKVDEEQPKIAPSSTIAKMESKSNPAVVKAEEVMVEGISDHEREKIMEEVIRSKYAIVDQIQSSSSSFIDDEDVEPHNPSNLFTEGEANPILEQDRLERLARQKRAITGGGKGSFRRG